jgi:hypothetical protein
MVLILAVKVLCLLRKRCRLRQFRVHPPAQRIDKLKLSQGFQLALCNRPLEKLSFRDQLVAERACEQASFSWRRPKLAISKDDNVRNRRLSHLASAIPEYDIIARPTARQLGIEP